MTVASDAIEKYLRECDDDDPAGVSARRIGAALGWSRQRASSTLAHMRTRGVVDTDGHRWFLVEPRAPAPRTTPTEPPPAVLIVAVRAALLLLEGSTSPYDNPGWRAARAAEILRLGLP